MFDFKNFLQKNSNISSYTSSEAVQDRNAVIKLPLQNKEFVYNLRPCDKENKNTAYYEEGILYDVYPKDTNRTIGENRGVAYSARFVVSEGRKYDLCNPKDVIEFKMPKFKKFKGMIPPTPTTNLAYIFNIRAKNIYQKELAIPTVFTAVNLLIRANGGTPQDFYRLISQLERLEEYTFASILKNQINDYKPSLLSTDLKNREYVNFIIEQAHKYGTDLVELPYSPCTCEQCAKYQGRVYSIFGKDTRFPKLPDIIRTTGKVHEGCRHHIQLFFEGGLLTKYLYKNSKDVMLISIDPIFSSNRPFIDDRSIYEKEKYDMTKPNVIIDNPYIEDAEDTRKYAKRIIEYEWILDNLPEYCPKSLSGYSRMKHSNSKNYKKLKDLAAEKGMFLDDNI